MELVTKGKKKKKKGGVSQTMGLNEPRGRERVRVGAAPAPGGARKAGCEKRPGSPGVAPHIRRKRGVAPKRGPRSLPQAVLCSAGTEVRASTGFAF